MLTILIQACLYDPYKFDVDTYFKTLIFCNLLSSHLSFNHFKINIIYFLGFYNFSIFSSSTHLLLKLTLLKHFLSQFQSFKSEFIFENMFKTTSSTHKFIYKFVWTLAVSNIYLSFRFNYFFHKKSP